jgi:glutamine amidotransferase
VRVVLADYGAGNLRSVCSALARAGGEPVVTDDPPSVREADLAVVAGVGNTGSAARGLRDRGLVEALLDRVETARPVFGICVGMQLLFGESEEGGSGLGIFAGRVARLQARHVPHMGWNELRVRDEADVLDGLNGQDVYFAHSFACVPDEPVAVAEVDHDGAVVAAVERGAVAGVQFHPERSGAAGAELLRNLLRWSSAA